jgi:hypothetical protein
LDIDFKREPQSQDAQLGKGKGVNCKELSWTSYRKCCCSGAGKKAWFICKVLTWLGLLLAKATLDTGMKA